MDTCVFKKKKKKQKTDREGKLVRTYRLYSFTKSQPGLWSV